jgi:ubiquinone/menaquinone biosynthesis C-methylase UbiE
MSTRYFEVTYASTPPENYERFFVPAIGQRLAADIVHEADLRPGERVLDVACGTGIVARLALQEVGGGTVTGLDVDPSMLAVARSTTPTGASVEWLEAGAEAMPVPDGAFDVVLCQISLQFVEDKPASLREMRRVLVPGGRIVLNVPGPAGPFFADFAVAMKRHFGAEAAGFVDHVFSLHDTGEIRQLIENAGFREVKVREGQKTFLLPEPGRFLWQYVSGTPLVGMMAGVSDEKRTALERELVERWQPVVEEGFFEYEQRIVTASAKK